MGKDFKADFAPGLESILIEVKYPTKTRPKSKIVDEIASDLTAYRTRRQSVLFLIFDFHRLMLNEAAVRTELGLPDDPGIFVIFIR